MKLSARQPADDNRATTEEPKRAWSKPSVRVMTVSFTRTSETTTGRRGLEATDEGLGYIPPTS